LTDTTFGNLGDAEPGTFTDKEPRNKAAVAITGGQVLARDNTVTPNVLRVAVATDIAPFFVADFNGALSTDLTVSAYGNGKILVQAGGAIQPYQKVICAAAGKVVTDAGGAENLIVGTYVGHMGEGTGTQTATAAANNDKIWVILNKK
jgi:hypothetical protein